MGMDKTTEVWFCSESWSCWSKKFPKLHDRVWESAIQGNRAEWTKTEPGSPDCDPIL